jgi:hypothetical protein
MRLAHIIIISSEANIEHDQVSFISPSGTLRNTVHLKPSVLRTMRPGPYLHSKPHIVNFGACTESPRIRTLNPRKQFYSSDPGLFQPDNQIVLGCTRQLRGVDLLAALKVSSQISELFLHTSPCPKIMHKSLIPEPSPKAGSSPQILVLLHMSPPANLMADYYT